MKKENKTRFIILGMLLDKPRTGYEIGEIIDRSTTYFWQESDASIYPMLKRLAREGKVESKSEFVGKRRKEIFSITGKGRAEFYDWFKRPAEVETQRIEFLLKFFFATEKDWKIVNQHLKKRVKDLEETLKEFQKIEKHLNGLKTPRKRFVIATLKNGIAHAEVDLAWVKKQLGE